MNRKIWSKGAVNKKVMIAILIFLDSLLGGFLLLGDGSGRTENVRQSSGGNIVIRESADDRLDADMSAQGTDPEGMRKIALTFDDGPHPHYTEQLLDGLKERDVQVTFFVTGEHAKLHPDVIKRMYEEGHLIGNHTYSHMQLKKGNREKFKEELVQTNEIITEITGGEVEFVRPPYGVWDKTFESELNMFPVLWTIDPLDWCSHNVSCITSTVVSKAEENDIILMHDYYGSTVTAALNIVDELQEEGYTFVTVDEILFD